MPKFELADGVAQIDREQWNCLVGDASPFLEWDWLASLEEAGCVGGNSGWQAAPLVAREGERLVAACPLYLKHHSDGEFVFDWGWADASERAGIPYYPKILVGVPFTPVTGARFLVAPGEDRSDWETQLPLALRTVCESNSLSGVHVNFCTSSEYAALSEAGFLTRIGFQYHWQNESFSDFEGYLARFRSKRRNQIRRERRALQEQGVEIRAHCGDEIPDELFATMYRFYLQTVRERMWGREYLNFAFFELLRDRFRERLVFIVAYQDGEAIAGTFNVCKGKALYGRYWGTERSLRFLHFNVCYYAAIEFAIERGLERFEPGAGGDYKQLRGFDAQPTLSGHYLVDPRLSAAVGDFLEKEREHADETIRFLRDQSALKPSGD